MTTMKNLIKSQSLSLGLAMFSMFFGAGNIIFPLAVGQYAGDKNFYAMLGLIITAAIMPIMGVIAMILYEGNFKEFFGRIGKIPGFLLGLAIISLLGPLGSTPRCITLAYATLKNTFLQMPPLLFMSFACLFIYVLAAKKNTLLTLLGWVLTPLLLLSLLALIALGFIHPPEIQVIDKGPSSLFLHGLKEGYNTMDLLAAFFFSSTILSILKKRQIPSGKKTALKASLIGAFLLAVIYAGFSYLAARHAGNLAQVSKDELLSVIALNLAGTKAGLIACLAVGLACLTTAIALISAFSDFVHKEVFKEKVGYRTILAFSLLITFFVSTFEFEGIAHFLAPILQICYPGLIILTILNIAFRIKNFKPIKMPVFSAFLLSAAGYLFYLA